MMTLQQRQISYVGQEDGVTAHAAQSDQKLQRGPQVVAPLLASDQRIPGVFHLRSR